MCIYYKGFCGHTLFSISKMIGASVRSVVLWRSIATDIPPCTTERSQSHRGSANLALGYWTYCSSVFCIKFQVVSLAGQIGLGFQQKCYLYFKGGHVGYLKMYCILGKPWRTGTKGPCATSGRTQILIGTKTAAGKGGWGQTRRKQ